MTYTPAENRYEAMNYRRAGSNGLLLPEFSLGLWHNFGDGHSIESQRSIVHAAFDLGVTHFDIANRYGPPFRSAEKNFGRILRDGLGAYRDELIIASKAGNPIGPSPYFSGGSRKTILSSLDHSLRDLGLDYVDIFYHHRPDESTPIEETVGALVSAVQQGKTLYVGISNYTAEGAHEAAQLLRSAGVPLLVDQPRYSIFDRTVEREGILDQAESDGFGIVCYSPIAQGLLTDKYLGDSVPTNARAASSAFLSPEHISDEYKQRARALLAIAENRGQTLPQMALQWALRQSTVTSVIIGASSPEQLRHNLAATSFDPFTDDELAAIDVHGVHGTGLTPQP